jgi:hypothetical protein
VLLTTGNFTGEEVHCQSQNITKNITDKNNNVDTYHAVAKFKI